MPAVATGAAILAPVVGGVVASFMSQGDRDRAKQAAQEAFDEINRVGAPPDLSQKILLEKFKRAGLYTPQLEQQISAGVSKVSQIQEDANLRKAQTGALNLLQERAKTGLNPEDRAAMNELRNQVATDMKGRLGSIQQNMASRGLAGGGSELAQELAAAESAQQSESAGADRLAAQASQAALQAAVNSGQLGGQIRGQDFDVNKAKAAASDQFKLFDTQNSVARQARNVGSLNEGSKYNLGEDQRISDINTNQGNTELLRENQAKRDFWNDQAKLAAMKSNAKLGQASQIQGQADAAAKMYQGIGSGVGAGAGAYLNYAGKNPTPAAVKAMPQNASAVPSYAPNEPTYSDSEDLDTSKQYKYGDRVSAYSTGGMVPGEANTPGDSKENDKVLGLLSPGEIVIPRTVVDHGPDAAYGFLHAILNKHKKVKK